MKCRHCLEPLTNTFLDLGFAPPSNAYLTQEDLSKPEKYFPLKLKICDKCWLVQTEDYATANELFSDDYAYFSSTSSTWLAHAESFSKAAIKRFELDAKSHVIEIASNDLLTIDLPAVSNLLTKAGLSVKICSNENIVIWRKMVFM